MQNFIRPSFFMSYTQSHTSDIFITENLLVASYLSNYLLKKKLLT